MLFDGSPSVSLSGYQGLLVRFLYSSDWRMSSKGDLGSSGSSGQNSQVIWTFTSPYSENVRIQV